MQVSAVNGDAVNKLKTLYLIRLSEFTTWPDEKMQQDDFFVCLNPKSELAFTLQETEGRKIQQKTLKIIYNFSMLEKCHVFYVSDLDERLFSQARLLLESKSVLTLSSETGFADQKGIIEYSVESYQGDKKLKMTVNLESLKRSKLKINARVLRLMKFN